MEFQDSISGKELGSVYQTQHEDRWIIENLLPAENLFIVGGAPKKNKSCIVQEMVLACVTGTPAFGVFPVPEPVKVLYLQDESPLRELGERFDWLSRGRGSSWDDLDLLQIYKRNLRLDASNVHIDEIIDTYVRQWGARVVVVDSLRMFHHGDEDDSGEMEVVMARLKQFRNAGATVLVVHHSTKQGEFSGSNPFRTLRGSSAIWAAADAGMFSQPLKDPAANVRKRKLSFDRRQGPTPEPATLTLTYESDSIQLDWDGKRTPEHSKEPVEKENPDFTRRILETVDDLGNPTLVEVATTMGRSERHLRKWVKGLVESSLLTSKPAQQGRKKSIHYSLTADGRTWLEGGHRPSVAKVAA
jgi:RecA-family ATPase